MAKAVANPMQIEYTKAKAEKITFTSNQLKLIAIAAMVFDHCMVVFIPHDLAIYEVLRMPGRLTAPLPSALATTSGPSGRPPTCCGRCCWG